MKSSAWWHILLLFHTMFQLCDMDSVGMADRIVEIVKGDTKESSNNCDNRNDNDIEANNTNVVEDVKEISELNVSASQKESVGEQVEFPEDEDTDDAEEADETMDDKCMGSYEIVDGIIIEDGLHQIDVKSGIKEVSYMHFTILYCHADSLKNN